MLPAATIEAHMASAPYVPKPASAAIPLQDLRRCAEGFTLKEIKLVGPAMVICLSVNTFLALRYYIGDSGKLRRLYT